MKRKALLSLTSTFAAALLSIGIADAQENGYINGVYSLFSFNPSTGSKLSTFSGAGTSEPFAVASDDVTLYLPSYNDTAETLSTVSGQNGQTEDAVVVEPQVYNGVALTKDGSTAYVTTKAGVSAVNTDTLAVRAVISQGGPGYDVALSPDDSTLYMSVDCPIACSPPMACPLTYGVCAFSTGTFALEWKVNNVSGLLSVSNDGSSLYIAGIGGGKPLYPLNAISTSTRAVTNLEVSSVKDQSPVRIVTDPASHYAIVIEQNLAFPVAASAYLLNTSNNKFFETLFMSAPGGMVVPSLASGAVFAPDGKSVWMLLSCGVNI